MRRSRLTRFAAFSLLALAAFGWAGCGNDNMITAPAAPSDGVQAGTATTYVPTTSGGWTMIAQTKVNGGHAPFTLSGSRYSVMFGKGALDHATTITMYERDPNVVDLRLDPDGTKFANTVTLTISYAGTRNDPASPFYTGQAPQVGRFNPSTGGWAMLSSTDDPATKTITVTLTGFSRYAMGDGMTGGQATKGANKLQDNFR